LSQYTVPTQEMATPKRSGKSRKRNDAYQDFHHLYQLLAKAVDGNGDRGWGMIRDGLNRLINDQYELNPSYKSTSKESSEGMVSLPATCTEKVGKRKHKVTSPSK